MALELTIINMNLKHSLLRCLSCLGAILYIQLSVTAQISPEDQKILDSLIKHDAFFKMLNEIGNPKSLVRISLGVGTMPYTNANKSVQTLEKSRQLLLTPSAGYYHKSGFGITAKAYAAKIKGNNEVYQYALSPSYAYSTGNTFDAMASYAHYFRESEFNSSVSLLSDEFVASVGYKKSWLSPRIIASYARGEYKEAVTVDTSYLERNRLIILRYNDTAITKIKAFSLAACVEHDFVKAGIFSKKDGLRFTPQVGAYFGQNNFIVDYNSTGELYRNITKKKLKRVSRYQTTADVPGKFEFQSVGLDLNLNYMIGKMYFEPDLYLDYYLHGEDSERFSQVYNFNIGITF